MGGYDLIVWTLFVAEIAMMEASMFHQIVPNRNPKIDEHVFLQIIRVTVYLIIFGITTNALVYLIPVGLMFPFIHDGVYYVMRNKFDSRIYPDRWKADSITTDARFNFSYKKRTAMFFVGAILLSVILFFQNI